MDWPEITKDTPLEEVRRIHRAIWQYVVENGEKPDTPYECDCVLCEYTGVRYLTCDGCPAKWQMDKILYKADECTQKGSPYYWWRKYRWSGYYQFIDHERIPYTKTQLAEMIRDIPFKGDDK